MIHYFSVDLFWNSLVKATISSLHVEDRNLFTLCRNHRNTTISITIQQYSVRFYFLHQLIRLTNYVGYRFRRILTGSTQKIIRLTDAKFLKEYLIQFIVIILSGMYDYMFRIFVQFGHYPAQLYNLRSGTNNCHYFQHSYNYIYYSLLISRALAFASSPISSRTKRSLNNSSFIPSTSKRRVL